MARAPETGFYFEPICERLALVVEGSPFPSDDHWAWLGDPIAMTPEQAQLLVAVRWPGINPADLVVEFDLNFDRAVKAKEQADREEKAGVTHLPLEFAVDIDQLLAQANELREQVRQVSLTSSSPKAAEAAAEIEQMQALIERARELSQPTVPGRAMTFAAAPPQSTRLLHGEQAKPPIETNPAATPALPPAVPHAAPALAAPAAPALIPEIMPEPPRPPRVRARPQREPAAKPKNPVAPAPKPLPSVPPRAAEPETKPEPKPGPRRPNIRDKR